MASFVAPEWESQTAVPMPPVVAPVLTVDIAISRRRGKCGRRKTLSKNSC
jgi:hypothetical protein